MIDCGAMPAKKKVSHSEQAASYAVGDGLKVNLHTGRIVVATIKAIIERTDGKRLQVDFGKNETALVHLWQVRESPLKQSQNFWNRRKKTANPRARLCQFAS